MGSERAGRAAQGPAHSEQTKEAQNEGEEGVGKGREVSGSRDE